MKNKNKEILTVKSVNDGDSENTVTESGYKKDFKDIIRKIYMTLMKKRCSNLICTRHGSESIGIDCLLDKCSVCGSNLETMIGSEEAQNLLTGSIAGGAIGLLFAGPIGGIIGLLTGSAIAAGVNESDKNVRKEWY